MFVKSRQGEVYDLTTVTLLEGSTTAKVSAPSPNSPPRPPLKKPLSQSTLPADLEEPSLNPETPPPAAAQTVSATASPPTSAHLPTPESYQEGVHGDSGSLTRLPKIKSEVKAEYPQQAKEAGISGPVVLEVIIGQDGRVKAAKVLRGPGYGLEEAALQAIAQFEFQPAFKDKEPVAVKIQYTYRFKLDIH